MERRKCTADNYFGCLSICLLSHIYGFMITFNHPQKNYLGEFTEQYNSHCNPIDTFDFPDKIKSQQLLFVITTPVFVNTIQILLDTLIKQTLADYKSWHSELFGVKLVY